MADYEIPFHIEEEIMKRLTVKSLIRFRCVSKAWKSLIDSSEFIAAHSLNRHTHPQHLLVSYHVSSGEAKYVSYIDDNTIPPQMFVPALPLSFKQLINTWVVGSSHGLVCLYGYDPYSVTGGVVVIWNPSIRKSIVVAVPDKSYVGQEHVGFGVCPVTTDPKIVAIKQSLDKANMETGSQCEVIVYTLSSGEWRNLSTNLPTKLLLNMRLKVVTDGFIYWLGGLTVPNTIISFDVTNESFEMIDLPDSLARDRWALNIYKPKESLAILQYHGNKTCTIWIMEDGVQRSFTKLFTINARYNIIAFRRSGVPIVEVSDEGKRKHVVYEPNSEHSNVLEVSGDPSYFTANSSYTETLLLLGRSDCSSY